MDEGQRVVQAVILFLRGYFASEVVPPELRWSDDQRSHLVVTGEHPHDVTSETRPALVVMITQGRYVGLGMTGLVRKGLSTNHAAEVQDLLFGQLLIACLSKSGGMGGRLARMVTSSLRSNVAEVQKQSQAFINEDSLGFGTSAKAGDMVRGAGSDEWMVTPVSLSFSAGKQEIPSAEDGSGFHGAVKTARIQTDEAAAPQNTHLTDGGLLQDVAQGPVGSLARVHSRNFLANRARIAGHVPTRRRGR